MNNSGQTVDPDQTVLKAPKFCNKAAQSVDPDQTAPKGSILSRSTLFAFLLQNYRHIVILL